MAIIDVLEKIRSGPVPGNEEATKMACVVPILQALGWDTSDLSQVHFEHKVTTRPLRKVDIALATPRGRKLAFLEVKAPGKELRGSQVLRYAFYGGVDICAITTGIEWWLYLPWEKGDPSQRRFAALNVLENPIDQLANDLQNFLAKEQLTSGSALERAKKALGEPLWLAVWQNMCCEPDHDLVRLVAKRISDERVRLQPSHDQIAVILRGGDVLVPPEQEQTVLPPNRKRSHATRKRTRRRKHSRPTGYRLWNVEHQAKSHRDVLQGVAMALYEKHSHDFDRALELRERKAWISKDPSEFTRPGRKSRTFRQIGTSPYYIYVNLSGAATEKRAQTLLKHFGYKPSDLEILFA